ncbi:Acyl-CoA N-acyltransferase [Orpheovirus IHUMI-LCC2]|uniref:Acyl-CoA N-acyltransferase n=1 Tax=Orpheovirus IHUMI-LCC2 TaxID=2023057 RepID=A0A2I2L678_9VIRU|nr:Acyl-CoA N-acyltransferase [Orpheovirus IHUMI-LCC2]SNW63043.1 Acyl-CoA N-acyltransferase [Orpheovirus IHUMI-LCC2]
MIIKKFQVNDDTCISMYDIIEKAFGKTGFKTCIFDNFSGDKDYWYVYLCYHNDDLLGYSIVSYQPKGMNEYSTLCYNIPKIKFELCYLFVNENERKKGVGRYILNYIIEDIGNDIFVYSIAETYMFYLQSGGYVLSNDFPEATALMVIPSKDHYNTIINWDNKNIIIEKYLRDIMNGNFSDSFIRDSIDITIFLLDDYYCTKCKSWGKFIKESYCILCKCGYKS